MKRFVALALVGSFPLIASAGPPVSVHPPAQPTSMNQPLSAAVQAAGANLPPAPALTSQPTNWGGTPCPTAPACEPACGQPKPYFNALAPRGTMFSGTCLERLKEWATYNPAPCNLGRTPTPYQAPLRAYFTCRPTDGSPGVGCGTGCGTNGCKPVRGGVGALNLPVSPLRANSCDAPTERPRVRYTPLTCRSEVPTGTARPRLLDRLFGLFGPACGTAGDDWCAPAGPVPYPYPAGELLPANPAGPAMPPPAPPVTPPTTPPAGKGGGQTIQLSPRQAFTNP